MINKLPAGTLIELLLLKQTGLETVQTSQGFMETLVQLQQKNYKLKFRRESTCLYCIELDQWIMPWEFTVDESYYFEEVTDPGADRMLYAISSPAAKGFLVDTCRVYTDNISHEMMEQLRPDKAMAIIYGND